MDEIREKAAAAFGLNGPAASDIVKRSDYATDAEFYSALADMDKRLQDPAFRRAIRKAREAEQEEDERKERDRQRAEFKAYRKNVRVEEFEWANIDKQATQLAHADLADGKIGSHEVGARIAQYAEQLAEKLKDQKASAKQINALFRRQAGR